MSVEQAQVVFNDIMRIFFPANIWNWDYIAGLWARYTNITGFIFGIIVLVILYMASDRDGFNSRLVRIVAIVALINAMDGVYLLMMNFVNTYLLHQPISTIESNIQGAFNPFSILVVVLVIAEYYQDEVSEVFFFGLSTFGVGILLFGSGHEDKYVLIYLFIRVVLAAIICLFCAQMMYASVSYTVMGIFFIISEATQTFIIQLHSYTGKIVLKDEILLILGAYKAEYIIIIFIALLYALYEIFIISEGRFNYKNLSLGKVAMNLLLIFITSGIAIYVGINKL